MPEYPPPPSTLVVTNVLIYYIKTSRDPGGEVMMEGTSGVQRFIVISGVRVE